jgi:hypothetical protein
MGDGAKTQAKTVNFWIEQKTAMAEGGLPWLICVF